MCLHWTINNQHNSSSFLDKIPPKLSILKMLSLWVMLTNN
jgi:hypothetical protein